MGITLFIAGLFFKMRLDVLSWTLHSIDHGIHFWWTLFGLIGQFTPVLALYGPFGVDVPLNFDITHTLGQGRGNVEHIVYPFHINRKQ